MNLNDLLTYRDDLLKEHQLELSALDRLIARERARGVVDHAANGASQSRTTTEGVAEPVHRSVNKALPLMGNSHFTQENITAALKQMNISMVGWGPRAVGVNLWRRAKLGQLAIVKKGSSEGPAVYRKS